MDHQSENFIFNQPIGDVDYRIPLHVFYRGEGRVRTAQILRTYYVTKIRSLLAVQHVLTKYVIDARVHLLLCNAIGNTESRDDSLNF